MLVLDPGDSFELRAYVDAAFCSHPDGKSHTGMCVMLGDACVMAKSSKKKIVTKDSTEAELVGLTDKLTCIVQCYEFVRAQGYNISIPTVQQDNCSTISLVTQGGGKPRNKHLRARQYLVLDYVKDERIKIEFVPTNEMIADILTKPLQGKLYEDMCTAMTNSA